MGNRNEHQKFCKSNPVKAEKSDMYYESLKTRKKTKPTFIRKEYTCEFCKKIWNTTKSGFSLHTKACKENPNRVPPKGHPVSEETKIKLKLNSGGFRKNAGRGRRGYYKGLYCMSTWELAWVVYQLDHGLIVEQCKDSFEYIMNGELHHYTPDFIIDDVYYEIKNWHRPDTDFKLNQFPKDKKIVLIEGKIENKLYLNYAKETYGDTFWENLYENYKEIKKVCKNLEELKNTRWRFIEKCDIDFSKKGWQTQLSKLWNLRLGNVKTYIKNNYKDFYENNCY